MGKSVHLERLYSRLKEFVPEQSGTKIRFISQARRGLHSAKPEKLLVAASDSSQQMSVNYFGNRNTVVEYRAETMRQARRTFEALCLPSHSENLGEMVGSAIIYALEQNPEEPVIVEQQTVPGYEGEFELLMKRFVWVWSGREIDERFYRSQAGSE